MMICLSSDQNNISSLVVTWHCQTPAREALDCRLSSWFLCADGLLSGSVLSFTLIYERIWRMILVLLCFYRNSLAQLFPRESRVDVGTCLREIWWRQIKPFVIICIANIFPSIIRGLCVNRFVLFLSVVLHNSVTILLMFPLDWRAETPSDRRGFFGTFWECLGNLPCLFRTDSFVVRLWYFWDVVGMRVFLDCELC